MLLVKNPSRQENNIENNIKKHWVPMSESKRASTPFPYQGDTWDECIT
jgi:hypothetical protein